MTDIPPDCTRCGKGYYVAFQTEDVPDEPSEMVDKDPMITTAHEDDGVVFFHA